MKSLTTFLVVLGALIGGNPQAQATKVYIPLGSAGEIIVVDAGDDLTTETIGGVEDVHGLAAVAGGRLLVAGSFSEAEPGKSALPPKPKGLSEETHRAHHMKPDAPATGKETGVSFVSIIRTEDREVMARVPAPGAVHHVAATPDSRHAIVTHPNADSVSVIDLSAYSLVKTIRTGSLPNYVVSSGDGKRVYVSNAGDDTIAEIDAESWTLRRHIPAGTNPEHIILSRDDTTLYASNVAAGTVSEIALAEGRIARTFEIGGTLHGIDLSDDQGTLFVSAMERNELVAVDRASGAVRRVTLGPSPYHLTVIRGTGKVYVTSAEEPKLWVIDAATLRLRREIPIRGKGHQMTVSEG